MLLIIYVYNINPGWNFSVLSALKCIGTSFESYKNTNIGSLIFIVFRTIDLISVKNKSWESSHTQDVKKNVADYFGGVLTYKFQQVDKTMWVSTPLPQANRNKHRGVWGEVTNPDRKSFMAQREGIKRNHLLLDVLNALDPSANAPSAYGFYVQVKKRITFFCCC